MSGPYAGLKGEVTLDEDSRDRLLKGEVLTMIFGRNDRSPTMHLLLGVCPGEHQISPP